MPLRCRSFEDAIIVIISAVYYLLLVSKCISSTEYY